MAAPKGSAMDFKKLDANHALAAKVSLALAMPHLVDAVTSLEFGVPCEDCEKLRMILTFVDCAASLTKEAVRRLAEWPTR